MGNFKTTYRLLAVLAVIVVLVGLSHLLEPRKDTSSSQVAGAVFPGLVADEVTRIEMKKGDMATTLELVGGEWRVKEQSNYPADIKRVESLLGALRRYNDASIYSDKKEIYKDFSVTEETGILVGIYAGDKKTADFIAGKTGFTPSLGYIRKVGDGRVLEVYGNTAQMYNPRPAAWVKTIMFDIKPDDIAKVKVRGTDEFALKREDNKWSFDPDGPETPNDRMCGQYAYYLSAASFKDVVGMGPEKLAEAGLVPPEWTIEFTMASGIGHKLELGKKAENGNYFARADGADYVLSMPAQLAELLRATRTSIITGTEPTKPKPEKAPHGTKYTVEGKGEPLPIVKIVTNKGEMAIELWEDDAPNTVANFIYLVDKGFYNGLTFHRFEPGRVLQGGDPNGDGSGGPGWRIEGEVSTRRYDAGVIGMADAGVDTGGSQFFFAFGQMQQWDPRYTCFGKIVAGMDVLAQIGKGDSIVRMEVLQRRSHAYLPYVYKDGSEKEERLPPIEVKPKESPKP